MFDKWFKKKDKDKNDEIIQETKDNNIAPDKQQQQQEGLKKFNFSKEEISFYNSNNEVIKKEIFKINSNFTRVIHTIDKNMSANYNINYADIRIIYEELINLTILKYLVNSQLAKKIFTSHKDLKHKLLSLDPNDNKCTINFKESFVYDVDQISKYMSVIIFKELEKDIDNSVDVINTCMNNIVNIEINTGLKELKRDGFNVNEYVLLFNTQLYDNLGKILTISNMCKNEYILNSIKNYKEAQQIK